MQRASPHINGINQFEEILVGFTFTSEIDSVNCLAIPLIIYFFSFASIFTNLLRLALRLP